MASQISLWTNPSLQRYRPVLFALTALAVGCTIYYVNESLWPSTSPKKLKSGIHRSNARRHSRRRRPLPSRQVTQEALQDQENRTQPGEERDSVVPRAEYEHEATDSENSWEPDAPEEEESKDGQSLLNLLYRIAEEQTRKDGYVHRGVQCNSCSENPIRGIRYRCLNCTDYDLCEQCEALQIHPKTHLFCKIRIPAPFIGHRERQPVLYPGKPITMPQDLQKEGLELLSRETGLKIEEVEAIWEQFRCMAATEYLNDPSHYCLAIDRPTFDKCFVPTTSSHRPRPNLIYDRLFSYYDTNRDGLIGLEEFVMGIAYLKKQNADARLKRIFQGFDLDGDGYIDRRDVLRIFRAYYALTRELTAEVVAGMQDDTDEGDARDVISGGQPISSAFTGTIPDGHQSRAGQGKERNSLGDDIVVDGLGALDNEETQADLDFDGIIADNAERAQFGGAAKGSGKEIYDIAHNSDWPTVVAYLNEFQVKAPPDPDASYEGVLRQELHMRLAGESLRRRLARRRAIHSRAQRQYFVGEPEGRPNFADFPREAGGLLVDPRLHTRMAKDLIEIKSSRERFALFKTRFDECIANLGWPIDDVTMFRDMLQTLVVNGWNQAALIEDLDGFSAEHDQIRKFVDALSNILGGLAGGERGISQSKEDSIRVKPSGRSRSSSKVRFEDGVGDDEEDETRSATSISSRNRPVNERWGGFEMPEPEADIGREILYQVTQEALMELLDPLFKLREDLALTALVSRTDRALFRPQIAKAVTRVSQVENVHIYLEYYQRRWREGDPLANPADNERQRDESLGFREFFQDMELGKQNGLTGSECEECKTSGQRNFIRVGEACAKQHANKWFKNIAGKEIAFYNSKQSPTECKRCASTGEHIVFSERFCSRCGQKNPSAEIEVVKLRQKMVNGGQTWSGIPNNEHAGAINDNDELANCHLFYHGDSSVGKIFHRDVLAPASKSEEAEAADATDATALVLTSNALPDIAAELNLQAGADSETVIAAVNAYNDYQWRSGGNAYIVYQPRSRMPRTLSEFLLESGYRNKVPQTLQESMASSLGQSDISYHASSGSNFDSDRRDPTLPQNRPNAADNAHSFPVLGRTQETPTNTHALLSSSVQQSLSSPSSPSSKSKIPNDNNIIPHTPLTPSHHDHHPSHRRLHNYRPLVPSEASCRYYAAINLLEVEDEERGGPGRLNFTEFEEVMKGSKGASLGFIAGWLDIGGF